MPSTVRIIAGRLRGSKLPVPDHPGLRPTPDRLRETLYNWLGPWLVGKRVADLYAGTGALGIEAASRGAAKVSLVERERSLVDSLRAQLERLKLPAAGVDTEVAVLHSDALTAIRSGVLGSLDLALVDPPFSLDLWGPTLEALERADLQPEARVYVEYPVSAPPPIRPGWRVVKQARAGDVAARLIEWRGA
jgi:16S rRNA (guanine966-N2)-methyltransferase